MGAGASAQASEAVVGASAEDIQALLEQLSPEDRAKLSGALASDAAPVEAEAAAEAVAEAAPEAAGAEEGNAAPTAEAKAEEAKGGATEAAADAEAPPKAGEGAPFLAEYFDKVQVRTAALLGDPEKLMGLALDAEAKKKLTEESKEWFESVAKPLLRRSFKHHDTKDTDVLDKDEAAVFFAHMVKEETDFAKAMSALSIEAGIKVSMGMLGALSEEEREQIKPQLEAQMRKSIEVAQAEVQKKEDNYKANKAACDVAAFKVLDTNADGTIQVSEFLAAFEPDTEKNVEMHIALGYLTQEEVDEQKKRELEAQERVQAAENCTQQ